MVIKEMICDIFWFLLNVPSMYKEYVFLFCCLIWRFFGFSEQKKKGVKESMVKTQLGWDTVYSIYYY
jgi:hypothetical protein